MHTGWQGATFLGGLFNLGGVSIRIVGVCDGEFVGAGRAYHQYLVAMRESWRARFVWRYRAVADAVLRAVLMPWARLLYRLGGLREGDFIPGARALYDWFL